MKLRNQWRGPLTALGFLLGFVPAAQAVPAFSRKHDLVCSQCHSAWPMLNKFGRDFKENGYRLEPGSAAPKELAKIGEKLFLEKDVPLAARIISRPVDKESGDARFKLRVAHELEVFLAGSAFKNVSFFAEFETEDENDWVPRVRFVTAGWHPTSKANIVGGWNSLFSADPYNSFADSRRLTAVHVATLLAPFAAGYGLSDEASTQYLTLYGRAKNLYYSATAAAGASNLEGGDKRDFLLRAAYDFPGVSVGAFYLDGRTGLEDADLTAEWDRAGFDVQVEKGNFVANAVWYRAKDDVFAGPGRSKETNNAWYVQGFYAFKKDKEPLVVPFLRYESLQSNDGRASTSSIAAAVVGYLTSNISLSAEYWKQTAVPQGGNKDDRSVIQVAVAF